MSDDFTFQIKADADQAIQMEVKVTQGLDDISAKAKKTGKDIGDAMDEAGGHMGDLIALAAGFVGAHVLEGMADGYTEIGNRLRVVATDQDNLNGLMDATLKIALDTRVGWEDVAATYQRLSNVTKALGLSQQDVLDLQKEMAQAAKVSGATSREAGMAMGELSHAFATGTVQGREFRVLMRDVPQMMAELQQASGKTVSQFAEMGKHGQITAQMLIEWFGKAKDDIADKFGKTIPTIGEMMGQLHDKAMQFFGDAATGGGVMRALGDATKFVIAHFEAFAKVAMGLIEAFVGMYVIQKVIGLVQLLGAAIAANPLGALVVAAVAAVSVLRQFGDEISIDSSGVAKFSDVLAVLWQDIKAAAAAIVDFLENAWSKLTDAFSDGLESNGIELSLKNVLIFIASFADAAIGIFKFIGHSVMTIFGAIPVALAQGLQGVLNDFVDAYNAIKQMVTQTTGEKNTKATRYTESVANTMWDMPEVRARKAQIDELAKTDQAEAQRQFMALTARVNERAFAMGNEMAGLSAAGKNESLTGHFNFVPEGDVAEVALQKFKEDWNNDVKGTSVVKDMVSTFMNEVDKHAQERVAGEQKRNATVSTERGTPEAIEMTDKQRAALLKLENALRGIEEQSNPVVEAQVKLAHAQDIVNQAVNAGLRSWAQGDTIMTNFKAKLADQLDPYSAMVRKIIEHASSLKVDALEQERAAEMERLQNEAKKAGITLTDTQLKQLEHLVRYEQDHRRLLGEERSIMEQINGPAMQYKLTTDAIGDLLKKESISATQAAFATDQARLAFLKASEAGRTVQGGAERAWLTLKAQILDVGTATEQYLTKQFNTLNDAIVQLTMTGALDFKKMIDSMIADLFRLLLQMEEAKIIKSFFGGPGAALTPAQAAALPGHAWGGSWNVGGTGGTDSQVVAFRASPNERVTVSTPEQDGRAAAQAGYGGGGKQPVHVHNHFDRRELLNVIDTPDGHASVVNAIRKNAGALKSIFGR